MDFIHSYLFWGTVVPGTLWMITVLVGKLVHEDEELTWGMIPLGYLLSFSASIIIGGGICVAMSAFAPTKYVDGTNWAIYPMKGEVYIHAGGAGGNSTEHVYYYMYQDKGGGYHTGYVDQGNSMITYTEDTPRIVVQHQIYTNPWVEDHFNLNEGPDQYIIYIPKNSLEMDFGTQK